MDEELRSGNMEEVLQDLEKEAVGPKAAILKKACLEAINVLHNDHRRSPSYQLRQQCFDPLRIALETRRTKLVALAITGLNTMLQDNRFHKGVEPEDDSLWLPSQLLCTTSSLTSQTPDTQLQILRTYLSLALSPNRTLNGRLVLWLCGRCSEAYGTTPQLSAAARGAAAQTVRSFCMQLDEEFAELSTNNNNTAYGCFNEVIPLIQYQCSKLADTQMPGKSNAIAIFYLECLLTLISSLPDHIYCNIHFTTFLWQKFCPALISFLGTPRIDTIKIRSNESHNVEDSGRGSGVLASAPTFDSKQAKIVYSIVSELVRLVGCVGGMRPVLEASLHRMLLYPPVAHRHAALLAVKEMLREPRRLARLTFLLPNTAPTANANTDKSATDKARRQSDDMAIVRLIMDAIEECGSSTDLNVMQASLECVLALLGSLQALCEGQEVPYLAQDVTLDWPNLEDADYKGPLTYQSLARLPSPYRDVVAGMQNEEPKSSDSSDTSGPEVNSSASEADQDSDTDSVFLPTRDCQIPDKSSQTSPMASSRSLPNTLGLARCNVTEYNVDLERHNAKEFMKSVQYVLLPKLFTLRTCVEVDDAMQDFASQCCKYNAAQPPSTATIMNADGIYLSTYSALLLNYRLIKLDYYNNPTCTLPMSEDQFVDSVQGSGVLVYLSAAWLRELYQQVLATSVLQRAGYLGENSQTRLALIYLLIDLGGLGTNQIMCDWQRLKEASTPYSYMQGSKAVLAGKRISRRILTCIWDSMISVLSAPLIAGKKNKKQKLSRLWYQQMKTLSKGRRICWEALINLCLEGLHKAANVSNTLGLQNRCGSILALLAKSACSQTVKGKISATNALSLDILITGGIELGSKAPDCWEYILEACEFVASLEHSLFGQQANTTTPIVTLQTGRKTVSMVHTEGADDTINYSLNDETCVDVYNFLQPSIDNPTLNLDASVVNIIEKCREEASKSSTSAEILQGTNAAKVCCALSFGAESLFTDAANKLSLPALTAFLTQLCQFSYRLLFVSAEHDSVPSSGGWWSRGGRCAGSVGSGAATRLLCRVGDVALRCLRAPRPLAHRMAAWAIVGPHFMQAACHKDRRVSSRAIQCIYDAIAALLNQQVELPHFHFNEALLKPFENLLCLELCDTDVQEQIISCICEFVETNRLEIGSGWRPLFNTLRAASNSRQHAAILEIFKVFLSTDNTLVFANAALDCILCLLSHVKGVQVEIQNEETIHQPKRTYQSATNKSTFIFSKTKHNGTSTSMDERQAHIVIDMCKESLFYLESCATILAMMYNMPKCPIFNTGQRVKGDLPVSVVDPIIPSGSDITKLLDNKECTEEVISYHILSTTLPASQTASSFLSKFDKACNIIKVWYVLIEGLVSATIICHKYNQPCVMETLFKVLKNVIDVPGPNFGLHCINHLLLPMVQNWLRQISKINTHWDSVMPNFKQCCGLTTDIVVVYLHHFQQENVRKVDKELYVPDEEIIEEEGATFALKQMLLILVECIAQSQEPIARLGASCIRHIILTSGHILTESQWEIVCISIHRACNVSLMPLRQLTMAFNENSHSFYGDLAIVKVAARRDCTVNDNIRLHAMAQQVFFNDIKIDPIHVNTGYSHNKQANCPILTDDRSYVFLLYLKEAINTLNPDLYTVRIPHRALIVGLLAHQILVQIIASVILHPDSDVIHSIDNILLDTWKSSGMMPKYRYYLTQHNVNILLKSLELSYSRAVQFDSRPGLKFLIQKVSNIHYAANLYKQTSSSWLIKMLTLMEAFFFGASRFRLQLMDLNYILEGVSQIRSTKNLDFDTYLRDVIDLKNTWEFFSDVYAHGLLGDDTLSRIEKISQSTDKSDLTDVPFKLENEIIMNNPDASDASSEISVSHDEPKPFTFADFRENSVEMNTNAVENNDPENISVSDCSVSKDIDCDDHIKDNNGNNNFISSRDVDISVDDEKNEIIIDKATLKVVADKMLQVEGASASIVRLSEISRRSRAKETVLPPQPVPAEIEQQRLYSISKDAELERGYLSNLLLAIIEIILGLPRDRFEFICLIVEKDMYYFSLHVTDPRVKRKIEVFMNKKDTV